MLIWGSTPFRVGYPNSFTLSMFSFIFFAVAKKTACPGRIEGDLLEHLSISNRNQSAFGVGQEIELFFFFILYNLN